MLHDQGEEQGLKIMSLNSLMADQVSKVSTTLHSIDERDKRFESLIKIVNINHDDANALMNGLNAKIVDRTNNIDNVLRKIQAKQSADYALFEELTNNLQKGIVELRNKANTDNLERMNKIDKQERSLRTLGQVEKQITMLKTKIDQFLNSHISGHTVANYIEKQLPI